MRHGIWIVVGVGCGIHSSPGDQPAAPAAPAAPAPPAEQAIAPPRVEPARDESPAAARKSAPPARRPSRRAPNPEAQAMVDAHNRMRAKHCAAPLTWSPKLAQVAQRWATTLRDQGCRFGHSGGSYGENLAAGTTGVLDPEGVVAMWYDEVARYKFPDGGFSAATGHFTQVVWRNTTQVGCGKTQCKGMEIWVCEYDPPGNWEGQYRDNVLPTGCR